MTKSRIYEIENEELGVGIPITVYIDDDGDLVIANRLNGQSSFLTPTQTNKLIKILKEEGFIE